MKYRRSILIIFCLVLFSLLTSCSPWVVVNQSINDRWISLDSTNTIGQTFVADYSGLQALYFLLAPQAPGDGTLTLHLRSDPNSDLDLVSVKLPIREINTARLYRFDFQNISTSNNQYYYAFLAIDGKGSTHVGSGPANAYQNGAAYQNHIPLEAQLTYSVDYDQIKVIIGLVQQALPWILVCSNVFFILSIPGWALLSLFWSGWKDLHWLTKLPLSIGASMAIYTLVVLFTFLMHLQLGRWYAWIPLLAGILVLVWRNKQYLLVNKSKNNLLPLENNKYSNEKPAFWLDISLIITLGLLLISRFWAIRGLETPMWNDSLHHTEIAQLITDNQGLFNSWLPYTPYQTFSIHFGFPLTAALLGWVTGLSSSQAILYVGQILNIFAPLVMYPIAVRLARGKRMGGVIAVLVAGLLSPMPAFYINWGRYAQLGGQVILPVAMWMVWDVVEDASRENESRRWRQLPWAKIIITAGVIAGMVLFEFRMIFIITTFVIALSISQLIKYGHSSSRNWLKELLSVFFVGMISIFLFLPWGLRLQHSNLKNYVDFNSQTNTLTELVRQDYQTWRAVNNYLPTGIIILGIIGLLWSCIKRHWMVASVGLWIALMASLYSLSVLQIPWTQYVQSFAVIISLYLPAGLLVGYLSAELTPRLFQLKQGGIITFAFVVGIGILGVWNQRNIANPDAYGLVTRPDIQAMEWIREWTPINSLFLIEGTHENWVTNVIGTDAGWWIPLLAHRENTIPPQYALANEVPMVEGFSRKVVDLEAELEAKSLVSKDAIKLLCEFGVTHVYIGQKHGMVANTGEPLFTPDELAASKEFQLIYHQDRVYIYSIEGACGH